MNSTRKKLFELSHHLGNVRSLIADVKLNESLAGGGMEQRAEIVMSSDDYPFGTTIGETHVESEGYRYGFNGMEKDDELKGSGNSYDFGARMYDPRTARFIKPDDLASKQPSWSSYKFANNNPNYFIDPDGNTEITYRVSYSTDGNGVKIKSVTASVTYYVVNLSSTDTYDVMQALKGPESVLDKQFDSSLTHTNENGQAIEKVDVNFDFIEFDKYSSIDDLAKIRNKNVLFVVDGTKGGRDKAGWGEVSGSLAIVEDKFIPITFQWNSLVMHELGHNLGLNHLSEEIEENKRFVMYPTLQDFEQEWPTAIGAVDIAWFLGAFFKENGDVSSNGGASAVEGILNFLNQYAYPTDEVKDFQKN